jgi:hypothetical protein
MEADNMKVEDIVRAFQNGTITMERMVALVEEFNLRSWVISQVNAMDTEELIKMIEFINTTWPVGESGDEAEPEES